MNKAEFLDNSDVRLFVNWAVEALPNIPVSLDITRKGTGRAAGSFGPGLTANLVGMDSITRHYQWRGQWEDADNNLHLSCDWNSTRRSLADLSTYLRQSIEGDSHKTLVLCCHAVLKWGGSRNRKTGAWRFIGELGENLHDYMKASAAQLSLAGGDTNHTHQIQEMNSMLTKVHALASTDGLPIYDSRVAASIASLVEMCRQSMDNPWHTLPEPLVFKAADVSDRRSVRNLRDLAIPALDPGTINRGRGNNNIRNRTDEWASSKLRLGWLIESIILESEQRGQPLFPPDTPLNDTIKAKMHAFEAGLFMMGFDTACFRLYVLDQVA